MKLVIYTTSTCSKCVQLKEYLNEKGTEFEEVNLHEESHRMAELQEIAPGTAAVPVIVKYDTETDYTVVHGFEESEIEELIK